MSRRKVHVAYTGGTIGMRRRGRVLAPEPGYLEGVVRALPEWGDPAMPEVEIHEYAPLLDSANMEPADWERIAAHLREREDRFDGFVVLHGTDTMAYTASALPFLLGRDWDKPVVVTGAQVPIGSLRTDARANLVAALLVAAREEFREVSLLFGPVLLRGNRAVKTDAEGFEAFSSPNHPPLARIGVDILPDPTALRRGPWPEDAALERALAKAEAGGGRRGRPRVGALRLFPGLSAEFLENALRPPVRGLVIEVYGRGNGPDRFPRLLDVLAEAAGRGVVVVAVTQCVSGTARLGDYASGAAWAAAGVVGGGSITTEAAIAKLDWLLGLDLPPSEVRRLMSIELRGEGC